MLIAITAVALQVDGVSSIWARRPFLGGLATGALSLAFTVMIVDRWLTSRDNQRWARVAAVAYRGVARESRDISSGLASLYCDLDHEIGARYKRPDWTPGDLTPLDEIREIPPGKEDVKALSAHDLPRIDDDGDGDLLPAARVRFLLNDAAWRLLATEHIALLVDRNRTTVARWAPLMMAAEEPRDLLDAFASLNDELFVLSVKLRHVGHGGVDGVEAADMLNHWRIVDGKARLLTNELWRLAGEGHYALRLVPQLEDLDPRTACATVGELGGWKAHPHPAIA
jgi:hypothetical protein